jgi:methionine-rich copper-binding protein CopC
MESMTKQNRYAALELLILALCVTLASSAAAEEKIVKPQDLPATVIAHLPLPQSSGSQMLLQRENAKLYLYVQQAAKQGFMVIDVTKPEKPSLLKRTAESNQATSGNLEMVSPDVAIAEAPEKTPATLTSSNHPTETVRVLDLSDPRNPKTLETFNKVTSILPDGTHSLIYITNNEGLWILRYTHPSLLEPAKKKPPCDSNSEIMAMPPDCD